MMMYVVVQTNILGVIGVIDVYEDEITALREANSSTLRKVIPKEVVPA